MKRGGWRRHGREVYSAIAAAALALALLVSCRPAAARRAGEPGILRISQRNEPADLDSAVASLPDEFFIIRALGEGLVAPAPGGGEPRPAAAERWDISPDGRTYIFHLRANASWSNGEPVTAADFVASYRRVLTPATGARKAGLFFLVENARAFYEGKLTDFAQVGFSAPDPHTLRVTLEHPSARFLQYTASGPWIPVNPRVVERLGRTWTRPGNLVGNGPFILTEWRPHQRIIVSRNPRYWNSASILLKEIRFIALDSGDAEELAYRSGEIDVSMAVPFTKLPSYKHDRPGELYHAPLAETRYLAFNPARPPLNDIRVRRALSLASDRGQIVSHVLHGGEQSTENFLPLAWAAEGARAAAGASSFDPAEARRLLADAGFPVGKNFPTFELSAWAQSQKPVLEALQAMWHRELGIEVTISLREAKVQQAALRTGGYDVALWTVIPDVADPVNVLKQLTTGDPDNVVGWSNSAYDATVAELAISTDAKRRQELLAAAEGAIAAGCPIAPVYCNAQNWLMQPYVHGWQPDPLWTRFYAGVSVTPP